LTTWRVGIERLAHPRGAGDRDYANGSGLAADVGGGRKFHLVHVPGAVGAYWDIVYDVSTVGIGRAAIWRAETKTSLSCWAAGGVDSFCRILACH